MNDDVKRDNELAAFTDKLLAGESVPAATEIEALAQTVEQLYRVIDPHTGPDPGFRARLAQRLDREWTQQERPQAQKESANEITKLAGRRWRGDVMSGLRRNRGMRLATMAAGVAAVLLVVFFVTKSQIDSETMPGTTDGSLGWPIIGIAAVGILGVLVVFWLNQRRKL